MRLTDITAKRTGNFFTVTLMLNNQVLSIKFDTGACNTVISADILYGELSDEQKMNFKNYCEIKGIIPKPFEVTTGNIMMGYPVAFDKVEVNGVLFPQFYCYVVVDIPQTNSSQQKGSRNAKRFALLGDDFLDCCGYSHEPHSDIKIYSFDEKGYSLKGRMMTGKEISELFSNE